VPPAESDLDEVRHAAFELRYTDPSEAARILRRLVKRGGEIEALAHGALGEILLDDFDDVDGAIHHFQKLLKLAPGMPAGEIGLARGYGRNGEVRPAQEAYARALAGLEKLAREAMQSKQPESLEGADETILTTLELAVEERELLDDHSVTNAPLTHPSAELLDWAEQVRLFDAGEEEEEVAELDDWIRFAQLRAVLASFDNQVDAALSHVDRISALVPFPVTERARLRSVAYEAGSDYAHAGEEALAFIKAAGNDWLPNEMIRAGGLLLKADRKADAHAVVKQLQDQLRGPDASALPADVRKDLEEQSKQLMQDLIPPGLVMLGRRGGKTDG
jgi:hypothetical protein